MRNTVCFLAFISLAGCSSTPIPVSSSYFSIPPGSKLVLNQTLIIPPNNAQVDIQYGKVINPKMKDNFYAHCWFLSWYVRDTQQIIKPGTFTITYSQKLEDYVSRHTDRLLAMNGSGMSVFGGGGPMALVYSTEMHIHSDEQPDIRRFGCGHWENPDDAHHLTVAQMQKALGNIAKIEIITDSHGPVKNK